MGKTDLSDKHSTYCQTFAMKANQKQQNIVFVLY